MKYLSPAIFLLFVLLTPKSHALEAVFPLHSHNDYDQTRILDEALENNFKSVEADIWLSDGEVKVSHFPWNFKGTLEDLYLRPLQKKVDARITGASHQDPFLLWIDIKDFRESILEKLFQVLTRYPMIGKEVKIILTGNTSLKRKFKNRFTQIQVERDENSLEGSTEYPNYTWYSLKWSEHFDWDGKGQMSEKELEKLKAIVAGVHQERRKLRFYASPANQGYWQLMKDAEVDLIDTDDVSGLKKFWKSFK